MSREETLDNLRQLMRDASLVPIDLNIEQTEYDNILQFIKYLLKDKNFNFQKSVLNEAKRSFKYDKNN